MLLRGLVVFNPGAQLFGGGDEVQARMGHVIREHVATTRSATGHADECAAVGIDAQAVSASVELAARGAPLAATLAEGQSLRLKIGERLG